MSNTQALKIARDALSAASAYHGVQLMSDPPQDAWKFHRVAERIQGAIAAIDALAQQQPSAPSVEPVADLREKLIAAIAAGLVSTYHCNRVWSAWHVGTMSEDDFSPVDESDTPAEIADVVLSIIGAAPLMANGLTEAETAATASVAGLAGATKHTEAVDHAHELLRRLGYHRDGDHFINVNRAGAEAMHVSTIATIVHAALIVASATPPAAPAPAVQPLSEEAMKWRKAVQEAYGWLWHTNNEPMAPVPMWSPEQAAYQARKCLRELLTTAERGEAINAIAAHMGKIAGITAAPTKE